MSTILDYETDTRVCDILSLLPQRDAGPAKLVGYAARFNDLSENLGNFRERILPGAFRKSLESNADIRALFDHDPAKVLGRVRSGTLQLAEDSKGLRVGIDLPDTSTARDVAQMVARGDISGMSFRMGRKTQDRWIRENGEAIRELTSVDLVEVSIVSFPAYATTDIALRSLAASRFAPTPWKNAPWRLADCYRRLAWATMDLEHSQR